MKRSYYILLILAIALSSCSEKRNESPKNVEEMKTLLKQKRKELTTLQGEIESLNDRISNLEPEKEKNPILVSVQNVKKEEFKKFTTVQGSVMSDDVVFISSETGGRITRLNAKEGDYVRKGQLLATVDMSSLKNQIAEVETQLDLARTVYERQKRLWDQNIGSEIQYLQAESNVKRLEKSIATMQSQLNKSNIYSPISGAVDREMVKTGEVVGPGSPIFQVLNTNQLKVVADVPENYLGNIERGDKVDIFFPALNKEIHRKVSLLGRTIDPSNRTFKVEVKTSNPDGTLKPNLLAELKFQNFKDEGALTVPLSIVLEDVHGDKYVFLAKQDGDSLVAEKAYVEIGESAEGRVIINKGVKEGDKVIIDGARNVSVGDPLILTNQKS